MKSPDHQTHVAARFSAAARSYDAEAMLQHRVAAQLMNQIPDGVPCTRVLDLGCGTGRLTELVRLRWPRATVQAVDLAPGMIDVARERLARHPDIEWIVSDAATLLLRQPCDLLVTSSMLHWLQPFDRGLAHVATLVRPGGHLAAALMLEGTLCELHTLRLQVAPHKAPLARMPAFQQVIAAVEKAGLQLQHTVVDQHQVLYPSAAGMLKRLGQLGVNSGDLARGARPLTRREVVTLIDLYQQQHGRADGQIRASYVVGYFLALRP